MCINAEETDISESNNLLFEDEKIRIFKTKNSFTCDIMYGIEVEDESGSFELYDLNFLENDFGCDEHTELIINDNAITIKDLFETVKAESKIQVISLNNTEYVYPLSSMELTSGSNKIKIKTVYKQFASGTKIIINTDNKKLMVTEKTKIQVNREASNHFILIKDILFSDKI